MVADFLQVRFGAPVQPKDDGRPDVRELRRAIWKSRGWAVAAQVPSKYAAISGKQMVASDSMMKRGVSTVILPQVIFSLALAPL